MMDIEVNTIKVERNYDIPEKFTGIAVFPSGTKKWYKYGKLHREDGPAIEWPDGSVSWYKEGYKHREDGPTYESSTVLTWHLHGQPITPGELFEKMTPEQKEKVLWDLDRWK